jgi:hypothetical protein
MRSTARSDTIKVEEVKGTLTQLSYSSQFQYIDITATSTKQDKNNLRLFSALNSVQQCIAEICFIYYRALISQTRVSNRRFHKYSL